MKKSGMTGRRSFLARAMSVALAAELVMGSLFGNGGFTIRAKAATEQPLLDTDAAYVNELTVTKIVDGIAPFDATAGDGKDENDSNLLVRSYDAVKYSVNYAVNMYDMADSYVNGYILFEVDLPLKKEQAYFDTDVMSWMSTDTGYQWEVVTNADGTQKLKCAKKLIPSGGNATSIPGTGEVEVVVQVRAMKDQEIIQPTFAAYMDHNGATTDSAVCATHAGAVNGGLEYKKTTPSAVKVTTAPAYNIQVSAVSTDGAYAKGTWDFSTGNTKALNKSAGLVEGRLVGYGITLQLYNEETNKGIKGIEYPDGSPITFKLDMDSIFRHGSDSNVLSHATYIPLVWSYGPSDLAITTQDGRDISRTKGYPYMAAPFNANADGYTLAVNGPLKSPAAGDSCWNGGKWNIVQNGCTLEVTVSDYELNPNWFPERDAGTAADNMFYKQHENIGCFSAGEIFIVVPFSEGGTKLLDKYSCTSGTVDLTLTSKDFHAVSVTNKTVTTQKYAPDDKATRQTHLSVPGSYVNKIHYSYYDNYGFAWAEDSNQESGGDAYNGGNAGQDALSIGANVAINWGGVSKDLGDIDNMMEAGDFLMKFDPSALELDPSRAPLARTDCTGDNQFYYAVKADGTAWVNDDEMENVTIGDLHYYPTIAEAESHGIIVGILRSWRCDHSAGNHASSFTSNQEILSKAFFHIKADNALTGGVYQTVPVASIWTKEQLDQLGISDPVQVANAYEIANGTSKQVVYPQKPNVKDAYQKAIYDASGYAGGHTSLGNGWELGDSLYLAGYITQIKKSILQKDSSNSVKNVFDLDAGQNIVDYVLTPNMFLENNIQWALPTTVTIVDTLPLDVEYVAGSAVMGGSYVPGNNGFDGSFVGGTAVEPVTGSVTKDSKVYTTLTWTIPNVTVQYEQPEIMFKVRIKKTVANGQSFVNTATISTTEDQRVHASSNGNIDTAGFSVIKLANMSITKKAERPFYDVNDNLAYVMTWSNNSNNASGNKVLLDVMPRTEKNNSNYHGNYTIANLTIDSLSPFTVYYTTSDAVYAAGINAKSFVYADIIAGSSNGIIWKQADVNGVSHAVTFGAGGSDAGNVTAWAILTDVPAAANVSARVEIDPENNRPEDVYYNIASLDQVVVAAPIRIVSRSIEGITWEDINENGKQELTGADAVEDEAVLPGVTVTLYDESGNVVKNLMDGADCITTTDENGKYRFDYLPAGTFHVEFSNGSNVNLGNYTLTDHDVTGVDDTLDSDAVKTGSGNPTISGITLPTVAQMTSTTYSVKNLDAGFYQFGNLTIGKSVLDGETGENPDFDITAKFTFPAGLTVTAVMDAQGAAHTLDANGAFSFTLKKNENLALVNIPKGTKYVISEADHVLYHETIEYGNTLKKIDGKVTDTVTVKNQRVNRVLAGTTWVDANKNGEREAGEAILPGVTVTVLDAQGNVVKDLKNNQDCIMVTDTDGNYRFENLPAGNLKVIFSDGTTVLNEYTLTVSKAAGVDPSVNSDAALDGNGKPVITGIEMPADALITSSPYQVLYQDAGFYQTGGLKITKTVTDAEAADANDTFEVTVAFTFLTGTTVTSVKDTANHTYTLNQGKVVLTMKADDVITLTDLPAGTKYVVTEKDSPLYDESVVYGNSAKTIGHVVDDVTVTNHRVKRVLTGTTWVDVNQNGKREAGEEILPGVTVTVYDAQGNVVKNQRNGENCVMQTDSNGNYSFENLPAGTLKVVFSDGTTSLGEYSLTASKASGVDPSVNSDAVMENGKPVIAGITMPADAQITTSPYVVRYQDAGFWQTGELEITKTVTDGEAADANDTFTVTVAFTFPTGMNVASVKDSANHTYTLTQGKAVLTMKAGDVIRFVNLPAKTVYTVTENNTELYDETITYGNAAKTITTAKDTVTVLNHRVKRILAGTTWVDANQNGAREAGEAVLPGVTVTVIDAQGNVVKDLKNHQDCIMVTGTDGSYHFENLPAGDLKVVFSDGTTDLEDYVLTVKDPSVNAQINSDAEMENGSPVINGITMPADAQITTSPYAVLYMDAGFYQTGGIRITKAVTDGGAEDANDTFEVTVAFVFPDGMNVTAVKDSENHTYILTQGKAVLTMRAGQTISLINLPDGTKYTVTEQDTALYAETVTYGNAAKTIVHKVDDVTVTNHRVKRVLAGTTWVDANQNGEREAGETLLPGVKVTVYDADGNVVKNLKTNQSCIMETGADGSYRFENLPAGTLKVVFSNGTTDIGEYTLTVKDPSVNNQVNSDAVLENGKPVIAGIPMPADAQIINSPYEVLFMDAGFYQTGGLKITKNVTDGEAADADDIFDITVAFTFPAGSDITSVKDSTNHSWTLTQGKVVLHMKAGDVITLVNLPAGTSYVVSETDTDLYEESIVYGNTTKTIAGTVDTVTVKNHRVKRILEGTTWVDTDQDGKREPGEELLPGVTVTVYDAQGHVVNDLKTGTPCVAQTDADGHYYFENLPAGELKVVFSDGTTDIGSYDLTVKDPSVNEQVNSDAVMENGKPVIPGIVMPEDAQITSSPYRVRFMDAGFFRAGSLKITKSMTDGEAADADTSFEITVAFTFPAGVHITSVKDTNGFAYTLTQGKVTFLMKAGDSITIISLPEGTEYTVSEKDTALYEESIIYGNTAKTITRVQDTVTVKNRRVNRTLSGSVWNDLDHDGKREPEEPVMPGVTVTVYDEQGHVVKDLKNNEPCTVQTDSNGHYSFENLPAGTLTVKYTDGSTKLDEYTLTVTKAPGVDLTVNSDAQNTAEGYVIPGIVMPADSSITSSPYRVMYQDAGFWRTGKLMVEKTVVDGVTGENDSFDITVKFTFPGSYSVSQVMDTDGNAYPVTDGKIVFTLTHGEKVTIKDLPEGTGYVVSEADYVLYSESVIYANTAAVITTGTDSVTVKNQRVNRILEGNTWVDADKNGKKDDGEKVLPGVKVTVYDENDQIVTDLKNGKPCVAETDKDGKYHFENLPAGTFRVVFSKGTTSLDKYILTIPKADGVSPEANSDASLTGGVPTIGSIVMPQDALITSSPYRVTFMDAGFYPAPEPAPAPAPDPDPTPAPTPVPGGGSSPKTMESEPYVLWLAAGCMLAGMLALLAGYRRKRY